MSELFGYPTFDEHGEMILTTYDNEYSAMNMDIRVYQMKGGEKRDFCFSHEETAVLLLSGCVRFRTKNFMPAGKQAAEALHSDEVECSRASVFTEGPWCAHIPSSAKLQVTAVDDSEILVQRTHNTQSFASTLYAPENAPWGYSCVGKFGNTAKRRVNTIFDHSICPESNMVLGEILNDRGNWSGYLPHRHPQPECYFFKFDRPEGFGASFVGEKVFKSVNNSFSAIPGGMLHPQAVAPGFQMYTVWMIRHIDGNPWLQSDRNEDEKYLWLHNMTDN